MENELENKSIFSKESLDRISSPEQLNDYVKVANPGVWMILSSIIILLIGAVVWAVFGRIDSRIDTCAIAKDGIVICYVNENEIAKISLGQVVEIEGNIYEVTGISSQPEQIDDDFTDYEKHVGAFIDGEWVYEVVTSADLEDGISKASIITESISPISFIIN